MSTRKPRFAIYDLERMKRSELNDLCVNGRIPIVGSGYTKQEIIDKIVNSGKVDIISAPPPIIIKDVTVLRGMGVGKLKKTMLEAGVFFDARDVVEKEDMVQIFINSGRVVFEAKNEAKVEEVDINECTIEDRNASFGSQQSYVKRPRLGDDGSCSSASSKHDKNLDGGEKVVVEDASVSSLSLDQQESNEDAEYLLPNNQPEVIEQADNNNQSDTSYSYNESADISSRSVGDLKQLARSLGVDLSTCLEKREMIEMIVTAMTRRGVGTRFGG